MNEHLSILTGAVPYFFSYLRMLSDLMSGYAARSILNSPTQWIVHTSLSHVLSLSFLHGMLVLFSDWYQSSNCFWTLSFSSLDTTWYWSEWHKRLLETQSSMSTVDIRLISFICVIWKRRGCLFNARKKEQKPKWNLEARKFLIDERDGCQNLNASSYVNQGFVLVDGWIPLFHQVKRVW